MRIKPFAYICDGCGDLIGFGYPTRDIEFKFNRKHFCSKECLEKFKSDKK